MYDIIVIGGGPAGITAAIYARRANKTVLVLEKATFGGQITFSPRVENIPGFASVTGNEFADKLVEQAISQGVDFEFYEAEKVIDGDIKTVVCGEKRFEAKAIIIATGAKHRRLGLPKEDEFIGDGISFCAVCDGAFFADKVVAVIGGGNSALQEALQLSELAKKVYVVQNLEAFTGEAKLSKQVLERENIEAIFGATVKTILGESTFSGIEIETNDGVKALQLDGMFVAIGLIPQNEPFRDILTLNQYGYADYDENCSAEKKGIFVAGDCRSKKIRQVATAVSDGAIAALAACNYLDL